MAGASIPYNLLIISDLHLGEDLKPATRTGYLRHLVILERELEAFLEHYARTRQGDLPWRLIVNGDMVDFLSVCLIPREGEIAPEELGPVEPEELVYGLGTRPQAARLKMKRVLSRHPGVFRALARFLAAGNRVSIVAGNHDVEFHWPIVQETFKEGVAAFWREELSSGAAPFIATPEEVAERISFHPWFFFEEGVVWVEHGHQYDEYCSFDYVLNPVAPARDEIVMSVGAAGLRYVANVHGDPDMKDAENWTLSRYLRWGMGQGARGLLRILRGYVQMIRALLSLWRAFARRSEMVEARRRTHRERLAELAAQAKLSEDTLAALHDLRRRPVLTNLFKLLGAIMLDRLLVAVAAALFVLVFVLALPWAWALLAVSAVLTAAAAMSRWLARVRPPIDPHASLREASERIRRFVRAPFVVFGHSHEPVAVPLSDGGMYFNTGTWVAGQKPGYSRSFTHILIEHDEGGPRAGLYRWCGGRSEAFRP